MLVQCIKGPVSVDNNHLITPVNAVPVSSTSIDSCLLETSIAIIEFYSEKCQTCANLTWVIDSLHTTYNDTSFVGAHNYDTDTLWKRYSITTVPTYILFKSSKEVTRRSFSNSESQIFDTLTRLISHLIAGTLIPDSATVMPVVTSNIDTLISSTGGTAVIELFSDN